MPPTTGYSFGDIVLDPFPFTDQSATKRWAAVIVSNERCNRERPDLIINDNAQREGRAIGVAFQFLFVVCPLTHSLYTAILQD
jgi:hypothetical protein